MIPALEGLEVKTAATAKDAIDSVKSETPDLVIVDLHLPPINGYEFAGRLRAARETRDIPLIFLEATAPDESEDCLEFVVRKQDMSTLMRRIEALVFEQRRMQAAREALHELLKTKEGAALTNAEARALEAAGLSPTAEPELAPVMRRIAMRQELLESSLRTAEAARRLGVQASRIRQRLSSHPPDLYAIRESTEWLLPAFQFGPNHGLVPNIAKVIARMDPGLDPVAVVQWFTSPNLDLIHADEAVPPLDWLKADLPWEPVAELADLL